jgi:hypothetical protein
MTRPAYDGCVDVSARRAEVIRVFERYLVEIVERYNLCPWAHGAREGGEIAVEVVWGAPPIDAWVAAAEALLDRQHTRVAMVIAPELSITRADLRSVRDRVALRLPHAGVAEFHPGATLDLASPGRLIPFVRASPDPLLQLVPLDILDQVRTVPTPPTLQEQAQFLGGLITLAPPRPDIAVRIAEANHASISAAQDDVMHTMQAIAADRAAAYARVGISEYR